MVLAALSVSRLALVTHLVALCPSRLALAHLARLAQCLCPALVVQAHLVMCLCRLVRRAMDRLVMCLYRLALVCLVLVAVSVCLVDP